MSKLNRSVDTSSSTLIIDYSDSLRARSRRQVTWSDVTQTTEDDDSDVDQSSKGSLDDDVDGGSDSFVIEQLDDSPSSRRRRHKRNRKKRHGNREQLPVQAVAKAVIATTTTGPARSSLNGDDQASSVGVLSDKCPEHNSIAAAKQKKTKSRRQQDDDSSNTSTTGSCVDPKTDTEITSEDISVEDALLAQTQVFEPAKNCYYLIQLLRLFWSIKFSPFVDPNELFLLPKFEMPIEGPVRP